MGTRGGLPWQDEVKVLDMREGSPNEGQVIPASEIKPVSRPRKPALAFSLIAMALALSVPMGEEPVEEYDFGPRRRR